MDGRCERRGVNNTAAPSTEPDAGRHVIRSYRMPAKVFHWLTVTLVVFMVSARFQGWIAGLI